MNKNYVVLSDNETAIIRKEIEKELYKTLKFGWSPYWYPLKDVRENIPI